MAWIFIFCLLMETQMIRGLMEKQERESIKQDIDICKLQIETQTLNAEIQRLKIKKWQR